MMAGRFFQSQSGILAEYFDGSWTPRAGDLGRICEPGHHFEWSWLLRRYAGLAGRSDPPIAAALKAFGDRHGFDADGFVVDALLDDGRVHKASRRCWPHTEAVKAEVAAAETGDAEASRRAARTIDRLMAVFLGRPVAGGWIDHVDANGAPIVDFMPASTLYHVFLAAAEADRVWGRQAKSRKARRPRSNERRGDPAGGDPGRRQGHAARRDHPRRAEADAANRGGSAVPRLSSGDDRAPRLPGHRPARRSSRGGGRGGLRRPPDRQGHGAGHARAGSARHRRRVDGRARRARSAFSPHERRRFLRHQFARPRARPRGDPAPRRRWRCGRSPTPRATGG